MHKPAIAFFDAKPYDMDFFNRANRDPGFGITYFQSHLSRENAVLCRGHDAACIFVNDTLDQAVADILAEAGIQLVALRSAGYNNVDLKAVYRRIHVVRVPAYSPHAVAEHAVALMLTLNRKTHKAYFRTRDNNFNINGLMGFDMFGKTAGIIGTGRIGALVAGILRGFGMRVLAYDAHPKENAARETGFAYVDLDTLYRESDIISLHCPLTPETTHLVNAASIRKMKERVMIINTGRGKLISTVDLIAGLKRGKIGAAGLDVYEEETEYFFEDFSSSIVNDDVLARLLTFPNVLITSHQGFFTAEALLAIATTTLENIRLYFEENRCPNEICYRCSENECLRDTQGRCF